MGLFGGVVLWVCPLAQGPSADVLIWDCKGPSRAKGPFKDCEVGANCIVPVIVPCLWEGADVCTIFVGKAFALLRGHFGRGLQIRAFCRLAVQGGGGYVRGWRVWRGLQITTFGGVIAAKVPCGVRSLQLLPRQPSSNFAGWRVDTANT